MLGTAAGRLGSNRHVSVFLGVFVVLLIIYFSTYFLLYGAFICAFTLSSFFLFGSALRSRISILSLHPRPSTFLFYCVVSQFLFSDIIVFFFLCLKVPFPRSASAVKATNAESHDRPAEGADDHSESDEEVLYTTFNLV